MKVYRPRVREESVQAERLTPENVDSLAKLCGGLRVRETDAHDLSEFVGLNVPTLEGPVRCSEGNYLLRLANGSWSVLSENEFNHRYEGITR